MFMGVMSFSTIRQTLWFIVSGLSLEPLLANTDVMNCWEYSVPLSACKNGWKWILIFIYCTLVIGDFNYNNVCFLTRWLCVLYETTNYSCHINMREFDTTKTVTLKGIHLNFTISDSRNFSWTLESIFTMTVDFDLHHSHLTCVNEGSLHF